MIKLPSHIPRAFLRPALRIESRVLTLLGEAAIHSQRAARPSFRDLFDAEVRVFSQWGEDGILDFICDAVELPRPRCLEIGAGNFTQCNTRWLAEARNASVVAVDAREDLVPTIEGLAVSWRSTVIPLQRWVSASNAHDIAGDAIAQLGGIDLISLDVDGIDYWILKAMDLGAVTVVVVEYNALFGVVRPVSVPDAVRFDRTRAHWSNLYYGASLLAFIRLLEPRGFTFVGTNRPGTNAFFVAAARLDHWPLTVPESTPEALARYVDLRVRESRDEHGHLTRRSPADVARLLAPLPLVDTVSGRALSVADCAARV